MVRLPHSRGEQLEEATVEKKLVPSLAKLSAFAFEKA